LGTETTPSWARHLEDAAERDGQDAPDNDGTIAFQRRAKGGQRFEIWTMTASGGSMRRIIVSNVRNDTQPSWLQDGRLVFASDRDNERDYDLFRATRVATGGWPHVRVTNAAGHDRAPNG
jgi:Tol biopolymer transport system component